jgi:hypothetical protein
MTEIITKPAMTLAEHVTAINTLGKQNLLNIIAIGGHLSACKEIVGHGNFAHFLAREFEWGERQARKFIEVWKLSKTENFADLPLPISSIYMQAAPSTPPELRAEVFEKAKVVKLKHEEIADLLRRGSRRKNSFDVREPLSVWPPVDDPGKPEKEWQQNIKFKVGDAIDRATKLLDRSGSWAFGNWETDGYRVTDEIVALARRAAAAWTQTADQLEQLRQQQRNETELMEAAE